MHISYSLVMLMLGFSIPSVSLRLNDDDTQTVLLMQAERGDHHLKYLYDPVMTGLRLGFESNPGTKLNVVRPSPSVHYDEKLKGYMGLLKRGDLLVWLGTAGNHVLLDLKNASKSRQASGISQARSLFMSDSTLFNFASLRDRGVKIVYYQSEPVDVCGMLPSLVDEMWDYSWHNIDNCKGQPDAPLQRYVPLAAYDTPVTKQKEDPGALLFFGQHKERPCWNQVYQRLNTRLEVVYWAWDDASYEKVLDTHNIFVNLHKGCSGQPTDLHNPVTWRNAKLLNAHALIISQRAYSRDEQEFDGLIDFVEIDDIPDRYAQLVNMGASARQQIADERARLFAHRFDPRRIFERAGIYGNLTRY